MPALKIEMTKEEAQRQTELYLCLVIALNGALERIKTLEKKVEALCS